MQAPETLWFLDSHITVQLASKDNQDGLSVLMIYMNKDDAPPLHIHHTEDEVFHVTEGEIRFQVDGAVRIAKAGDTVLGPRGLPHGFRVLSPEARMLVITRGGFEQLVRSASRPAARPTPPDRITVTPGMHAALAAKCKAVDIDLVGPPID